MSKRGPSELPTSVPPLSRARLDASSGGLQRPAPSRASFAASSALDPSSANPPPLSSANFPPLSSADRAVSPFPCPPRARTVALASASQPPASLRPLPEACLIPRPAPSPARSPPLPPADPAVPLRLSPRIRQAESSVMALERRLDRGHPSVGLAYLRLCQLYVLCERSPAGAALARAALKRALGILGSALRCPGAGDEEGLLPAVRPLLQALVPLLLEEGGSDAKALALLAQGRRPSADEASRRQESPSRLLASRPPHGWGAPAGGGPSHGQPLSPASSAGRARFAPLPGRPLALSSRGRAFGSPPVSPSAALGTPPPLSPPSALLRPPRPPPFGAGARRAEGARKEEILLHA